MAKQNAPRQKFWWKVIPGQSLSRIIFDLCGFSGAGLKITFGLRVMDSMTQFWCQKVGVSRLFCVILRHIFGPSKCDWQRANSAIVRFLVAHYFSAQTKTKCSFWMSRYEKNPAKVATWIASAKASAKVMDITFRGSMVLLLEMLSHTAGSDRYPLVN